MSQEKPTDNFAEHYAERINSDVTSLRELELLSGFRDLVPIALIEPYVTPLPSLTLIREWYWHQQTLVKPEGYIHTLLDMQTELVTPPSAANEDANECTLDREARYWNTCSEAEDLFLKLHASLTEHTDRSLPQTDYRSNAPDTTQERTLATLFYVDEDDPTPAILKKHYNNNTGLTLVPLRCDDTLIPAGTIVTPPPVRKHKISGVAGNRAARLNALPLEEGAPIRPFRLSPWAFDKPEDRAMFAHQLVRMPANLNPVKKEEAFADTLKMHNLVTQSLEDFQQAARQALNLCIDT